MAQVQQSLGAIVNGIAVSVDAVTSFIAGDAESHPEIDDAGVDATYAWLESEIFDLVALQAPVGRDLRFLTGSLRIGQAVERTGDLVASIGFRAILVRPYTSDPALAETVRQLGHGAAEMLRGAASAYAVLDEAMAEDVARRDDAIDLLHRSLIRSVYEMERLPIEAAVELGLVGRFYERIADHAVVIAERVRFISSSRMNPGDSDEAGGWSP
jgi:phosphate transport system protein